MSRKSSKENAKDQNPGKEGKEAGTTVNPITELVSSEGKYIKQLQVIKENYLSRLRTDLPTEAVDDISELVSLLISNHQKFLNKLEHCAKRGDKGADVGDLFLENRHEFGLYAQMTVSSLVFKCAISDASELEPRVEEKIENLNSKSELAPVKLEQLIERPLERIKEYTGYLTQFASLYPDYVELYDTVRGAMNEMIANMEHIKKDHNILMQIVHYQDCIANLPLDKDSGLGDYGRIVKEGKASFRFASEKHPKRRLLILFDMVLVLCKRLGEKSYDYKGALIVNDFTASDQFTGAPNHAPRSQTNVYLKHTSCGCVHTISCESTEERDQWKQAFETARDNGNPEPCREGACKHGFLQVTFKVNTPCDHCHKIMTGSIYQGYSCFKCQMAVHKQCIGHKNLKKCKVIRPEEH